jgi:hypothetical protein
VRAVSFLLLALLAVVTVLLHRAAATSSSGDRQLSAIASRLAGREVTIRCEGLFGALLGAGGESGRTEFVGDRPVSVSYLQEGVCQTLHAYAHSPKSCVLPCHRPLEVAWSMNTLAHESYHLAGIRREARTECAALHAIGFVARRLGASPAQAGALAAYSFAQLPGQLPPEYNLRGCR